MIKKAADLQVESFQNRFGGEGEVRMKKLLAPAEFCGKGRLFAHNVILPGSSIGFHQHNGDFETYYILKGKALVNDNGTERVLVPGDMTFCKDGDFHSIENIGDCDLEYVAVILYNKQGQ